VKIRKKKKKKKKKKPVDEINRELSGLAQKLSSLWPWEPV
jgi:hypothetical protein